MHDPTPHTPLTHAILLALTDDDRHGYGIIKEVERQTEGSLRPGDVLSSGGIRTRPTPPPRTR